MPPETFEIVKIRNLFVFACACVPACLHIARAECCLMVKDASKWVNRDGHFARLWHHLSAKQSELSLIFYTGLTVFVEGNDITRWFNSSNVDDDVDYTGLSITKKNTTQLIVAFKSGRTYVCRTNRYDMECVK